jgi:putative glycosyltransferase (TIGR04372 family)
MLPYRFGENVINFVKTKQRKIQLGYLHAAAIGHLAWEADMAIIKSENSNAKTIWITTKKIANNELLNLIKKKMFIVSNPGLRLLLLPFVKRSRGTRFDGNAEVNDITTYIQDSAPVSFPLPKVENDRLPDLLVQMKLDPNKKYVCLVVRDGLHSQSNVSLLSAHSTEYRNCSIKDFTGTVSYLNSEGYNVIRMGRLADSCDFTESNFFDYANSDLRSDINDLVILSNCEFTISTLSGVDEIATIYRRPVYIVNYLPVGGFRVSKLRPLVLPKGLRDKDTGKILTFHEIIERGIWEANTTKMYEEANVEYVNCSPYEITEFSKQALSHFEGKEQNTDMNKVTSVQNYFMSLKGVNSSLIDKMPKISDLWLNY